MVYGEIEFSGFFDNYYGLRTAAPYDFLSSRTRFRGDCLIGLEKISFNLSVEATRNNITKPSFETDIREAYLQYPFKNGELRLGRQIILWGNGERVRVTDIVSPFDLREYQTGDYHDIRLGVDALQLKLFINNLKFEFIWVPFFRSSRLPSAGDPWYYGDFNWFDTRGRPVIITEPSGFTGSSEFFGKISAYMAGIDVSFLVFSSLNDVPSLVQTGVDGENERGLLYEGKFSRLNGGGFEFSKAWDFIVFRGELIYIKGLPLGNAGQPAVFAEGGIVKWLAGMDIFLRSELTISLQFLNYFISEKNKTEVELSDNKIGSLIITKKFFRGVLSLYNITYVSLKGKDLYNRLKLDFALIDEFHVILGADIFSGDGPVFGRYGKNSQFWVKFKYIF